MDEAVIFARHTQCIAHFIRFIQLNVFFTCTTTRTHTLTQEMNVKSGQPGFVQLIHTHLSSNQRHCRENIQFQLFNVRF